MGITTILSVSESVGINDHRFVGQVLSRNQKISTSEIVTVVEGRDATPGSTDMVRAWLDEHRPAAQVEVHRGGQPLYPYLFGVE